ncbi:bacillolysin [Monoraphidium neglectum]|uniref:Bacillolysin n=1 Tax=Monoraphidium neglectum TaxID=145388 RepID=A0A0D2NF06_9CHLO|nr:bacillolysin [Monoraphidium neglectum]KIZ03731.1 bacillolysin [Monoraphidium neglectum]|eukprot:XP_013902750.1 bacillolysin [Monoraphidium neglectum]
MAARRTSPSGAAPARAAGASGAVQAALPSPFADLRLNCTGCGSLLCYAYSRSIPANTSIITRATLTAPATLRAGKPASYNPSTKEVLAWVSSHFNVPAEYFRVAKPTKYGDYTDTFKVGKKSVKVRHVRIEQVQSWISSFNPNQDFGALQVEFGYIFVHLDKNTVLAVTGGYIPSLFAPIAAAPSSLISPSFASASAAGAALAAAPDAPPAVAAALRAAAAGDASGLSPASDAASGGSAGPSASAGAVKLGGKWMVSCFVSESDTTPSCGPVWVQNFFIPPGGNSQPRSLDVSIDAFTGDLRLIRDNLRTVSAAVGVGNSLYAGQVSLPTGKGSKNAAGGQYELTNLKFNKKGQTFDWNNNPDNTNNPDFFAAATLFRNADNTWGTGTTLANTREERQTAAVDAHYGVGLTYRYFLQVHGRKGLDNRNTPINTFVHLGDALDNAFYSGGRTNVNECDGLMPLTPLEIAAHEVTHGVTE